MGFFLLITLGLGICSAAPSATIRAATPTTRNSAQTFRLYDGITAYVNNDSGKAFDLDLDVRDINIYANGPRELLVKVYDPDGRVLVRQVIPDDGITSGGFMPRIGGWDHEMWYYALNYARGSVPMIRWSTFSDPKRLAAIPARHFHYAIEGRGPGVYRVLIVGVNDDYVTLHLSPNLPYAVSGNPMWLHGHGNMFRKSYIYVPRGTGQIHIAFIEPDLPRTRVFKLIDPNGKTLFHGRAQGGFVQKLIDLDPPDQYDDQLLVLKVSPGKGDFMIHITLNNKYARGGASDVYFRNRPRGPAGVLASDKETALAVKGGAIYHDHQVFWHMFQVRFYDWVKKLKLNDLRVRDAHGNDLHVVHFADNRGWGLDGVPAGGTPGNKGLRMGYFPLVARIVNPPLCDRIMYSYPLHHNRQALNLALVDLEEGLRGISTGDFQSVPGFNGNAAYIYVYAWQYWRAAWMILQHSDAPPEVKAIVREAFILAGDRVAFARGQARVNGNVFCQIPVALKYCSEATGDPLQKQMFETYWHRFATEGWGPGTGISKSGDCQEHFAHEQYYGMLILENYSAPIADFHDPRFIKVRDRVANLYSYTWCRDANNCAPWSSRTSWRLLETDIGPYIKWKGNPGPDFTTSVNGGNEWFAARRKNYYALTFHGRLAPMWLCNHFGIDTRLGYGGGMLCQLTIPGYGTVIDSTLNRDYGEQMERSNWRNFHIHSIVGEYTNGQPLISADCEQPNAKLCGDTVTGSGEIRDDSARVWRSYTFGPDRIRCEAKLSNTHYANMRQADWAPVVKEAYEMIPFMGGSRVTAIPAGWGWASSLSHSPQRVREIIIERGDGSGGGYGVRIELDHPLNAKLGNNNTVLIQLVDKPTSVEKVHVGYEIVPYVKPGTKTEDQREREELAAKASRH